MAKSKYQIELEEFKKRVVEVAIEKKKKYELCDEVNEFLEELGLPRHNDPVGMRFHFMGQVGVNELDRNGDIPDELRRDIEIAFDAWFNLYINSDEGLVAKWDRKMWNGREVSEEASTWLDEVEQL